jgi:hypothetical protein
MIIDGPPATEEEVAELVRASTLDARDELTTEAEIERHVERLKGILEADEIPDAEEMLATICAALEEPPKKRKR